MHTTNKILWQCPNCGGILEKSQETIGLKKMAAGLLGMVTCSYCSGKLPSSTVYDGQFDFSDSDQRIREMANDRTNIMFDESIMRWRYCGEIVCLACDKL